MPQHDGIDILDVTDGDGLERVDSSGRKVLLLDPGLGTRRAESLMAVGRVRRAVRWICFNRSEISAARAFMDARKGRAIPFWLPTMEHDFTLTESPASSQRLKVLNIGYTDNLFPLGGWRRHVTIYKDGVFHPRKVVSSADHGDGTEWLDVDFLFSSAASGINPVMFLRLCRLDADLGEWSFPGRDVATVDFPIIEIPLEAAA